MPTWTMVMRTTSRWTGSWLSTTDLSSTPLISFVSTIRICVIGRSTITRTTSRRLVLFAASIYSPLTQCSHLRVSYLPLLIRSLLFASAMYVLNRLSPKWMSVIDCGSTRRLTSKAISIEPPSSHFSPSAVPKMPSSTLQATNVSLWTGTGVLATTNLASWTDLWVSLADFLASS